MKLIYTTLFLSLFIFVSCQFSGVEKTTENESDIAINEPLKTDTNLVEKVVKNLKDTLFIEKGIYVVYKNHGTGAKVKTDDVVSIDYACQLSDGKIFDTNKKMGKSIPFLVGWSMQTPGWDVIFPYLVEGDEVEVFLPADMSRGEKGIPNLVPPNVPNIITLKIYKVLSPDYVKEGVKVWVINRGKTEPKLAKGDEVLIDYFAYSKSHPRYDNSFKNGKPYQIQVGFKNNIPGLNIALENAQLSDKLWVMIPSNMAFGNKGEVDHVEPNESIFFDLRVLKRLEK